MPHFPKPFFRQNRGLWYVQVRGKQHNLGPESSGRQLAFRGADGGRSGDGYAYRIRPIKEEAGVSQRSAAPRPRARFFRAV